MSESVFTELSWRSTTLGALCAEGGGGVQTGPFGSQLHASDYVSDGIPSVMPQNIGDNIISADGIARITEADATRLSKYRLRMGDIIYSRRGDVEKCALIRPENDGWLCGTGCLRVRLGDDSSNDSQFISYVLSTEGSRAWIKRHAVGATMPNLNTSILASVPLMIPPPSGQRAIAEVLGALDDKIAANNQIVVNLALLATTTFEQAVRMSSTERAISEVAKLVSRGITPAYSDSRDAITVLNQKCIRDQVVLLGPARKTERSRARDEKILLPNDVLINSTGQGTLGRVARWTYDHEATVDSHISIVRLDENVVDPICGGYGVLRLQSLIEQMGEGSTGQTELSRAELAKFQVPLPDREIQLELGHRLGGFSKLQDAQRSQSGSLAAIRDALLPQLMSGKIRVKDAEKTVEEVL